MPVYIFGTSLEADLFTLSLREQGATFTYWHVSIADHRVTVTSGARTCGAKLAR